MDRARLASERTQVAAGVYDCVGASTASQGVNRLIDCKPFRYATEIDEHRSLEHHALLRKQLERAPVRAGRGRTLHVREHAEVHQCRSHRDVEYTVAKCRDVQSAAQ